MATVAELAARSFCEVAWLFVVEGWPVAWTDRVDLVGTGVSSWIGQDAGEAGRTVAFGLQVPESIKLAVGIVDTGMPVDDGATFTLEDRDDHLIDFMEDEAGDAAYERVAPTDDPAPSTVLGLGGSTVTLHGRHINGECIGASGERRQFQILPGGTLPGLDHAAVENDAGLASLRASTVRDSARWLEGRACALYLIRKDVDEDEWPSWSDQYDSGYSLLWWGTTKGATAEGGVWRVECEGPSSWLRKTLNANRPAEWAPLTPLLELAPGEDRIAVAYYYRDAIGSPPVRCKASAYTASDDITSGQTPMDLAAEIDLRLQDLINDPGTDDTFSTRRTGEVDFMDEGCRIKVDDNLSDAAEGGVLMLRMHQKAWLHLGWDLSHTVQGRPLTTPLETVFEVWSAGGSSFAPPSQDATSDPAPGFWTAYFTTLPEGAGVWSENQSSVDGDGLWRVYLPVYKGGGVAQVDPAGGQEWDLGFGVDQPYLEGQLARPPADVTIGSGACDRMGFFAVRGSRATQVDGEAETLYQLARVSWVDDATRVAIDPVSSAAVVWCQEWLDPKQWGASEKIAKVWAANDLEFVPIALLSYNMHKCDHAHRVLARLLLSTGTAAWSGVGDDPTVTITAGANAHPDAGSGKADDLEIADLGLGIPASMVDLLSLRSAAEALPGGIDGDLGRTRLAYIGPFDSQETIEDIIKPRGWCFSLDGGRYGLFARSSPVTLDDVAVALTASDVAGEVDDTPPSETVDFRPLEPVDLITVTYGTNQLGGESEEKTLVVKARDPRAQTRRGNAKVEINSRSLTAGGEWKDEFETLWGSTLARWFADPKALVRVSIKGDTARDLWPGTVVSYTSDWPATRNGQYGMTQRVGRVVSVERNTQTLAATVEILVEGADPPRRFGPIARLVDSHTDSANRHNPATGVLHCYADAFGRGDGTSDVAAFAEPSWSTTGGHVEAQVWSSWDGVTWEATCGLRIVGADPVAHTLTYDLDYVDPYDNVGIWENRFSIILPSNATINADQWPNAVFGVTCGPDGKFGGSNLDGYPWVDP